MPSPAQVLRSCLIDFGLVSYPVVDSQLPPCFVSSLPDEPDSAVVCFDVMGKMFGRDARTGKQKINPGVLVRIRTLDFSGYTLANNIAVAIDTNFPIETTLPEDQSVHQIQNIQRSQVISLGEETGTRRQLWVINAWIAFAQTESSIA